MGTRSNKRRASVYPAESDPRQVKAVARATGKLASVLDLPCDTESLAREFGPWVRAADSSWMRKKARKRK